MNPLDWIEAHSGAFTALSTVASAAFAWSIFRVERGRDLAANQVHGWVTGLASPMYVPEDQSNKYAFRLMMNLSNESKFPIYSVEIVIRTNSKFTDEDLTIFPNEIVYKSREEMILGNYIDENVFPIRSDQIQIPELKDYLKKNHSYTEGVTPIVEKLASSLVAEISFRDAGGKNWKRKRNGKLKRKRMRNWFN